MGLHMLFSLSCSVSHQKQLDFKGVKTDFIMSLGKDSSYLDQMFVILGSA